MHERTRRVGENEALFRSINEKIEGLNETFGTLAESMTVVCECGRIDCTEQIDLDAETYVRVRADATWFVVVPGHELPDVEHVVEEHEGFNVIQKDPGGPAELARELS
jgi:hypothetical protein